MSLADYNAYSDPASRKLNGRYDGAKKLEIQHTVVESGDRALWEPIFLHSYLRYRPLSKDEVQELAVAAGVSTERFKYKRAQAGHLVRLLKYEGEEAENFGELLRRRLADMKDVLELNWGTFTDDKFRTVSILAKPKEGQDVEPHVIVGISYATLSFDARYAKWIAKVEGTYVPNDYRSRGIGRQLLEGMARQVKEMNATEMQYWTHVKNPHTQNLYPMVEYGEKKSILTDERVWVVGLTDRTVGQYQIRTGQELLSDSRNMHVFIMGEDEKGSFKAMYAKFLGQNGYEGADEVEKKAEKIWKTSRERSDLKIFMARNKTSEDIGFSIIYEGIKLPRDAFLTAEIGAFYLQEEHRNYANSQAMLSTLAVHAKQMDLHIEAIRWTLHSNDPHLKFMDTDVEILPGRTVRPVEFPFKTYRLPLKDGIEYKGPVPSLGLGKKI